ncbi:kinesin motor domain-containing protein, partial [Haematococcus lacustris]
MNIEPQAIGVIPRCVAEIFKKAAADPFHAYAVSMSYIQIYMELIQDLLHPESDNLHIREDATNGVFVAGAHEVPVTTLEECLHYLELGERNRSFAFTHLNAHSSRSHAVVMVTVVKSQRYVTPQDKASVKRGEKDSSVLSQKVDAQSSVGPVSGLFLSRQIQCALCCTHAIILAVHSQVKVGKLYLVDLAGSERLKKSRSVGLRASEAKSINLSLTALGMCISARANDERHIPFRDSKLTRLLQVGSYREATELFTSWCLVDDHCAGCLLQESLGGNAKTTLLVCVADVREHADESLQSLQFGSRAMFVKNKPVEAMNAEKERLQAVISALREEGEERVAEIQMKAAEELAGVRQVASLEQARRSELEGRVHELEKKNANMAEVHYSAVAKLTAQVTDLLSTQASMSASHQRDVQTAAREQQATLHHLQQAQAEVLTLQAANLRMSHQVHKLHAVHKQVLSSLKHLHQAMAGSLSDSGAAIKISSVTSPPAALCSSGGAVGEPGSASPTADGSEAASIPDTPGTPDRRMSACDAQSSTQADAAPRIPSSYELAPPRDSLHCVASALVKTSLNPAYDQQSSCPASPLSGEDGEPLIGRLAPDCTDAQASNPGANSSLGGRRSSMLPRPLGVAAGSFASEGKRRASSTPQRSADSLFQPHPSAYDITSEALVGKCACVCDMMQRVADAMTQLLQSSKEKEAMVQTLQAEAVAASSAHAMA